MTRRARALVRRLEREARYLTRAEICDRLSVSKTTLYAWIRAGKFPSHEFELGAVRRWRLSTVAGWEAERMQGAA